MLKTKSKLSEKVKTPVHKSKSGQGLFRYGAVLPVAAVITVGLMVSMAALIATEFIPQDKSETASFEINPKVEDLSPPTRTIEIDPLRAVEVPPPPPTIEKIQTAEVKHPKVVIKGKLNSFEIKPLDLSDLDTSIRVDKKPIPHVRIPPIFPRRFMQGNVSGYCRVRFDISADGQPLNVTTTLCTDAQLKSPTVKSVQGWKYAPEIRDGSPVTRTGLETTIRFDLQDERGNVLPLPSGY